jgi:hypothetical protein
LRSFVPDLPEGFDDVVGKMTAKRPSSRYADAESLIADLETLAARAPHASKSGSTSLRLPSQIGFFERQLSWLGPTATLGLIWFAIARFGGSSDVSTPTSADLAAPTRRDSGTTADSSSDRLGDARPDKSTINRSIGPIVGDLVELRAAIAARPVGPIRVAPGKWSIDVSRLRDEPIAISGDVKIESASSGEPTTLETVDRSTSVDETPTPVSIFRVGPGAALTVERLRISVETSNDRTPVDVALVDGGKLVFKNCAISGSNDGPTGSIGVKIESRRADVGRVEFEDCRLFNLRRAVVSVGVGDASVRTVRSALIRVREAFSLLNAGSVELNVERSTLAGLEGSAVTVEDNLFRKIRFVDSIVSADVADPSRVVVDALGRLASSPVTADFWRGARNVYHNFPTKVRFGDERRLAGDFVELEPFGFDDRDSLEPKRLWNSGVSFADRLGFADLERLETRLKPSSFESGLPSNRLDFVGVSALTERPNPDAGIGVRTDWSIGDDRTPRDRAKADSRSISIDSPSKGATFVTVDADSATVSKDQQPRTADVNRANGSVGSASSLDPKGTNDSSTRPADRTSANNDSRPSRPRDSLSSYVDEPSGGRPIDLQAGLEINVDLIRPLKDNLLLRGPSFGAQPKLVIDVARLADRTSAIKIGARRTLQLERVTLEVRNAVGWNGAVFELGSGAGLELTSTRVELGRSQPSSPASLVKTTLEDRGAESATSTIKFHRCDIRSAGSGVDAGASAFQVDVEDSLIQTEGSFFKTSIGSAESNSAPRTILKIVGSTIRTGFAFVEWTRPESATGAALKIEATRALVLGEQGSSLVRLTGDFALPAEPPFELSGRDLVLGDVDWAYGSANELNSSPRSFVDCMPKWSIDAQTVFLGKRSASTDARASIWSEEPPTKSLLVYLGMMREPPDSIGVPAAALPRR